MPSINDFDPNDEDATTGFAGGGVGAAGAGPASSSGGGHLFGGASKQREQQYTPWSRFQSANSEASARTANEVQGRVAGQMDRAMGDLDRADTAFKEGMAKNYQQPPGASLGVAQNKARSQGAAGVGEAFQAGRWSSFGAPAPAPVTTGVQGKAPGGMTRPVAGLTKAPPPPSAKARPEAAQDRQTGPSREMAPVAPAPVTPAAPMELKAQPKVTDAAMAAGGLGPKDLEHSMTPDAWAKLTGEMGAATDASKALGSEGGLQALMQQQTGQPVSGFDAALVNGAGGSAFGQTRDAGKALAGQQGAANAASQGAWSKLTGDIGNQKRADESRAWNAQVAKDNARGVVDLSGATPGSTDDTGSAHGYTQRLDAFAKGEPGTKAGTGERGAGKMRDDLTTKAGFLGFLGNMSAGNKATDAGNKDYVGANGKTNAQVAQDLMKQLDMSWTDLATAVSKMTDDEYKKFMATGVVPEWMQTGPNATAKKGVVDGVDAYYQRGSGGQWMDPAEKKLYKDAAEADASDNMTSDQLNAATNAAMAAMAAGGGPIAAAAVAVYSLLASVNNAASDAEADRQRAALKQARAKLQAEIDAAEKKRKGES